MSQQSVAPETGESQFRMLLDKWATAYTPVNAGFIFWFALLVLWEWRTVRKLLNRLAVPRSQPERITPNRIYAAASSSPFTSTVYSVHPLAGSTKSAEEPIFDRHFCAVFTRQLQHRSVPRRGSD